MTDSAPTFPRPMIIDGFNHIPPPTVSSFDVEFSGLLPSGVSIPSSWGTTRVYDFSPNALSSSRRILMAHGGGTPALGLAPLGHKLTAAGNHVVVYDLWGHGLSSSPLEPHTAPLFHAQILEVLAYLGWGKVHLLGFSMGGGISATFTARHASMVESLILVAPTGLWRRAERGWWDGWVIDGGWGREFLSRRKIMDWFNGNSTPRPDWKELLAKGILDTPAIAKWERDEHKGHVASLVSAFRFGVVYDRQAEYGMLVKMDVKVLVILGVKDSVIVTGDTKRELKMLEWKGEVKEVGGATHEVIRSHSQEVADFAGAFWQQLEK